MHQKSFVSWAPPRPIGGAYSAPLDPLAGFIGKGGKRRKGRVGKRERIGAGRGNAKGKSRNGEEEIGEWEGGNSPPETLNMGSVPGLHWGLGPRPPL